MVVNFLVQYFVKVLDAFYIQKVFPAQKFIFYVCFYVLDHNMCFGVFPAGSYGENALFQRVSSLIYYHLVILFNINCILVHQIIFEALIFMQIPLFNKYFRAIFGDIVLTLSSLRKIILLDQFRVIFYLSGCCLVVRLILFIN